VSFAAIAICVGSQKVFIVVSMYFAIDSVRKLLDLRTHIFRIEAAWASVALVSYRNTTRGQNTEDLNCSLFFLIAVHIE
jgi:hypothetical protein